MLSQWRREEFVMGGFGKIWQILMISDVLFYSCPKSLFRHVQKISKFLILLFSHVQFLTMSKNVQNLS